MRPLWVCALERCPTLWERLSCQIRQVFCVILRHGGGRISPARTVMPQIPPPDGPLALPIRTRALDRDSVTGPF
jgi:hypothetical protein